MPIVIGLFSTAPQRASLGREHLHFICDAARRIDEKVEIHKTRDMG